MYRDVVDVYEQMDDNDDEEKQKRDMKKVQELINKITTTPLDLPADVQAAAVGSGSFVRLTLRTHNTESASLFLLVNSRYLTYNAGKI